MITTPLAPLFKFSEAKLIVIPQGFLDISVIPRGWNARNKLQDAQITKQVDYNLYVISPET